jgi:hypothetical protein
MLRRPSTADAPSCISLNGERSSEGCLFFLVVTHSCFWFLFKGLGGNHFAIITVLARHLAIKDFFNKRGRDTFIVAYERDRVVAFIGWRQFKEIPVKRALKIRFELFPQAGVWSMR